jgi:hypothetical protein
VTENASSAGSRFLGIGSTSRSVPTSTSSSHAQVCSTRWS